jgi:hypothetical protein
MANFTVKTKVVASQTSATITGTLGMGSASAILTINPPTLVSVTLKPTTVIGLTASTGTVTLSGPAPTGGMVVKLSSNQSAATVPASVTIAAGGSHATFAVKTVAVAATTVATITASLNGVSDSAKLTVNPPALTSLTLSPTSVPGGKTATGIVTLGSPAPAGGIVVSLASGNAAASVPASVTVPGGKNVAQFKVSTSAVTATVTANISATLAAVTKTASLKITK